MAYDSLLRHQRKTSHAVVGDALEALYPNRIEEHLDLLVHHFSRAENWMKAVRYGREAATKAGNQGQFAQALGMLEEVDSWLRKLPTDADQRHARIDVLFEMERLQETVGARDRQQALIDELHTLVDRVQDRPYMAKVYLRQGELGTLEGRFAEGEQALEKSASISRELSDTAGERNALRTLGFLRWQQGRQEEAMAANEVALAIDRANDDRAGIATDLCNMAAVLRSLGDHERALACLTEAVDIIESSGETVHLAYALQVVSNVYRDLGQTGEALKHLHRTLEIERRYRLFLHQPVTLNSIASAYWEQSKHDESLSVYRELVELTRDTNNRRELASALETLSQCLLILAKHEEALPYLTEGAEVFDQLGDLENAALMLSRVAGVHERSAENLATAEETWMETRNLRRQCNDKAGELEAVEAIARLRRKRARDPYEAVPYYLEALELAGDIGDRAREGELLNTIGILEWDASRFDEALTFYERALGIYRELDDQVHLGLILNSLGVTLKQLHRYEDAVARLEEALQVHRQTKERLLEAHAMAALGDVFSDIGDHDRAIYQYQGSLEIRRAIGDRKGQGWMLHYLARVQASQGLEQQARANSANALGIAEECRDEKLREACRGLAL